MFSSCNLGSINLVKHLTKTNKFDFVKFKRTIETAYTFLDDLIDINNYPTSEIEKKVKEYRQIGLGTMGLADVFVRMGIIYGSHDSMELTKKIFKFKQNIENTMNKTLGFSRGKYPKSIKNNKLRNANVSVQAPTGSLLMIAGVSASIEPVFSFDPIVRIIDGIKTEIFAPFKHNDPNVNVCANDLSVKTHVEMTGIIQKYVDMSISKTINLKNNSTVEDVEEAFGRSFLNGLKGVTVYRDGCRTNQTIQTKDTNVVYDGVVKKQSPDKQELNKITPVKRTGILTGKTFKDKIACGNLYTTINFDTDGNMLEIFVRPGKTGGCQSNVEAIARLLSMSLRSGIKISEIVDQLQGIRCPACMAKKEKDHLKFASCPDAVAKAISYANIHKEDIHIIRQKVQEIEQKINKEEELLKETFDNLKCPECGNILTFEAGCKTCKKCGWSKCG
jgi:ribonucleoside-diphosphate reductase alpha chain